MSDVEDHDDYFVQKRNAANVFGLSCFQKVTAAMRMLTYGTAADAADEYARIGESTTLESLRHFVRAVVELYEDEYLRQPNEADTARLLAMGEILVGPVEGIFASNQPCFTNKFVFFDIKIFGRLRSLISTTSNNFDIWTNLSFLRSQWNDQVVQTSNIVACSLQKNVRQEIISSLIHRNESRFSDDPTNRAIFRTSISSYTGDLRFGTHRPRTGA